jgi:lysophospholipid acyltransferase (LPLAT)-like uncharacterized protein
MAYAASRAWLVNWDKFVIPWPFARICIAIGPPVSVPRGVSLADGPDLQALQQQLQQELHRLARQARDGLTGDSQAQRL